MFHKHEVRRHGVGIPEPVVAGPVVASAAARGGAEGRVEDLDRAPQGQLDGVVVAKRLVVRVHRGLRVVAGRVPVAGGAVAALPLDGSPEALGRQGRAASEPLGRDRAGLQRDCGLRVVHGDVQVVEARGRRVGAGRARVEIGHDESEGAVGDLCHRPGGPTPLVGRTAQERVWRGGEATCEGQGLSRRVAAGGTVVPGELHADLAARAIVRARLDAHLDAVDGGTRGDREAEVAVALLTAVVVGGVGRPTIGEGVGWRPLQPLGVSVAVAARAPVLPGLVPAVGIRKSPTP